MATAEEYQELNPAEEEVVVSVAGTGHLRQS